ncbi:MAG: AsmA family protein, partial [Alphaproteobacteria bacterium]
SIDDLIGAGEPRKAEPQAPRPTSGELPRIDVGGIALDDARITWRDLQAGRTVVVDRLSLQTGRIANQGVTPIDLKAAFEATEPKSSGELSLQGEAVLDLDAGSYGARKLDVTVKGTTGTVALAGAKLKLADLKLDPATMALALSGLALEANGKLDGEPFEARASAPRLALTESSASGESVKVDVSLSGAQSLQASLEASGIGGSTAALAVAKLTVDATMKQGERVLKASLGSPLQANLQAGTYALPTLAGSVDIQDPAIPNRQAKIELAGSASADLQKEKAAVQLDAKAEGTALKAKADVAGFSRPTIGFDVDADQLDIDRFFPPAPASQAGKAPAGGTPPPKDAGADAPVDLGALANLDAKGRLRIGRLQARGIKASDVVVAVVAAKGRLDAAPVTASLYQGRLDAKAAVQAGPTPAGNKYSASADLKGIAIGPLLQDAAKQDLLEGHGNVVLSLASAGGTVATIKRGLDGKGAVSLRDGAIKGINLGETIRSARNLLQGGGAQTKAADASKKTDFTSLEASFTVKDGVASSNDLDVRSPLFRIGGQGRSDIAAGTLDYTVNASVVASGSGQGGRDLAELNGVTIPVRLTGPYENLSWAVDWETAGKEALKSRAANELKERLKAQDLEGKAKEKLGDSLKGLFRR